MCDPITLGVVGVGLSIAGTVGGYMQQQAQVDAANKTNQAAYNAQVEAYIANQKNAQTAFGQEQNAANAKAMQEQDASAQRRYAMSKEARRAEATTENQAASAGQRGLNIDALLADIDRQQAERDNAANTNLSWTLQDIQAQKGVSATTQVSRVNSVQKGMWTPQSGPGLGALGIGIASNIVGGYTDYNRSVESGRA